MKALRLVPFSLGFHSGLRGDSWLKPRLFGVVAIAVIVASCGRVASTFFDLPQKPKPVPPESLPPAAQREAAPPAVQGATRPPAELTLNPDSVLALVPRDGGGDLDWVAALRARVIQPRRALPGAEAPPDMSGFQYDFVIKGPDPMFDAQFPHSAHVEWLACGSCHPAIFPSRGVPITMDEVNQGEACGRCHGKVAFQVTNCYRCHTAMPAGGEAEPKLGDDVTFARPADSAAAGRATFPPARFAHWVHRVRYRCMACHPGLFAAQAGADTLTMNEMNGGRACGACHDGRNAFGLFECNRCHVAQQVKRDSLP